MGHDLRTRAWARGAALLLCLATFIAVPDRAVADETMPTVSAGGQHTCGLRADGTAACWGNNSSGQVAPPSGVFTKVEAGQAHSCGLRPDQSIECWGSDEYGQSSAPSGTFQQLSVGGTHNCAVRTDGTAACWGSNVSGQATAPGDVFVAVSAGSSAYNGHSCGLREDGSVVCWGLNYNGQLNAPSGPFAEVSAGGYHTCGVREDGRGVCWGYNAVGQAPGELGSGWRSISTGEFHNCGVRVDGALACWGMNYSGQTNAPPGAFTQVSASDDFVGAARGHSCGVRTDGTVLCWGDNLYGQVRAGIGGVAPIGRVGHPYFHRYATSPMLPGPTFRVASGDLPAGLALGGDGVLTGVPTDEGSYQIQVCATNGLAPETCVDSTIEIRAVLETTTAVVADPSPSEVDQQVTFTAAVSSDEDIARGTVSFTADGDPIAGCAAVELTDGVASCSTAALVIGEHVVEATYAGDVGHAPSAGSVTHHVTKAATTLTAEPAYRILPRFRATLTRTSDGAPIAGRTIAFRVGSTTLCSAVTRADGVASCSALAIILGRASYTAHFSGDASRLPTTATGDFR